MRKSLLVFVALLTALAVLGGNAEAKARKKAKVVVTPAPYAWTWPWQVRDPRLAGSNFVVGAGATGLYYGLRGGHHNGVRGGWHSSGAAYAGASVACAAASPIIGTLVVKRELTRREVLVSTANCALPFVGGWMMNAFIDRNPAWE